MGSFKLADIARENAFLKATNPRHKTTATDRYVAARAEGQAMAPTVPATTTRQRAVKVAHNNLNNVAPNAAKAKAKPATQTTAKKATTKATKAEASTATTQTAAKKATTKATKADASTATARKPAANVSKKRKNGDDEDGEEAGPAKKSRAAPKATANTSKKRKSTDDEESSEEEEQPPVKKARAESKKTARKPKVVMNKAPEDKLNIFVFGEGGNSELGLGHMNGAKKVTGVKRPRLNHLLSPEDVGVVQIATGGMHVVALTHDNKILTWGVNDNGALGRLTKGKGMVANDENDPDDSGLNPSESTPTAIPSDSFPEDTVFVQVAAGDSISVALTDDGFVYGWGTFRGNEGLLGFAADTETQYKPTLVKGLKKITSLACGTNHVLALDQKGAVFAWGSGQQNQLGRRVVERTRANGLIPREFGLPKNKIKYVACGSYHSFAIDKTGEVWAWGLNSFGQTGIGEGVGDDAAAVLKPKIVKSLSGKDVICMAGGGQHSVAVTSEGECLAWGRLDGGQTGLDIDTVPQESLINNEHGVPRIVAVPTLIPDMGKVTYADAGTDHTIAITDDGKAFAWGFSENYQTGLGQSEEVEIPTHIDNTAVREEELIWAGCGGQYSMLASHA